MRSRNYVFTYNNYTEETEQMLSLLDCRYLLYGREIAPQTGTKHLQGFVVFKHQKTPSTIRTMLPRAHIEIARGTIEHNYTYCTKSGDFVERGEKPMSPTEKGQAEVDRWKQTWDFAVSGKLDDIPPDILVRHYGAIKRICADHQNKPDPIDSVCGIWIYGESGSGKSHAVATAYPNHYKKGPNKWWDGYSDEEIVYFDDLGESHKWISDYLKHWADKWPFQSESKGFSRQLRPKKFIVTSQYRIEDLWQDEETKAALLRRFIVINKVRNQNIII